MSQRPAEKMSNTRDAATSTSRPRTQLLIWGGVLACTFIVLVAAAWAFLAGPKESPTSAPNPPAESQSLPQKPILVAEKKSPAQVKKPGKAAAAPKIAADSKPLWESPTHGQPLN